VGTHLSFSPTRVTGTMVNYYFVCKRKLWLFSRGLSRERDSQLVALGQLLHEASFTRERKEVFILGHIKVDHTTTGEKVIIHEVKRSKSYSNAARAQLLFYLSELERLGIECKGELHFRSEKRREEVTLDSDGRCSVQQIVREVCRVVTESQSPEPQKGVPCRRCSYRDYCMV